MKFYCGVDPGVSGAIAFYSPPESLVSAGELHVFDIPIQKRSKHTSSKEMNLIETVKIFREHLTLTGEIALAYIEEPHSMPNQGVVSTFTFGKACGAIEGIVSAFGIPLISAVPSVWKATLGLDSVKRKSIIKAQEIFVDIPNALNYFNGSKCDGRAEAALLAYLAHKKFGAMT